MSNVFVSLPALAGNGPGAAVDVSAFGTAKTITVEGSAGFIGIEISNDAGHANWTPIAQFRSNGVQLVEVACHWMPTGAASTVTGPAGTAGATGSTGATGISGVGTVHVDASTIFGDGSVGLPLNAKALSSVAGRVDTASGIGGLTIVAQSAGGLTMTSNSGAMLISTAGATGPAEPITINGSGAVTIEGGGVVQLGNSGTTTQVDGATISVQAITDLALGANGTAGIELNGNSMGFNGASPVTKPNVTGSRAANPALGSLCAALASLGLITNSTTT